MSTVPPSPPPTNPGGLTCQAWAGLDDLCPPCDDADLDENLLTLCLRAASDILFMLSGRRYPGRDAGACTDRVRPVASENYPDGGRPIRSGGGWWGGFGGTVGWASGYGAAFGGWPIGSPAPGGYDGGYFVAEQPLPSTPVISVLEVKVDGVVLDPSLYRVDDRRTLVRLPDPDGSRPGWPASQDRTLPDTEPGTWSVSYTYGLGVPPSGVVACGVLGCELAYALTPERDGECRLPQRVQHITRQGLDAVVLDPLAFIDKGRTGLEEVDLFLASVNPDGVRRSATVWRPGMAPRAHRTG